MSKKWLLGACGALLAGGLAASTANAGVLIDMTLTGVRDPGTTAFLNLNAWNTAHGLVGTDRATNKWAPIVEAGTTYRFAINATVTGIDNASTNDALASVLGNILSSGSSTGQFSTNPTQIVAGSGTGGNPALPCVGVAPFNQPGSTLGKMQDINSTGGPDLGSLPADVSADFVVIAGPQPGGQFYDWIIIGVDPDTGENILGPNSAWVGNGQAGAGWKAPIGQVWWTVGQMGLGNTEFNWGKWLDPTSGQPYFKGASWFEDTNPMSPGGAVDYQVGDPIVLNVIPEPAGLSLLGLGALGLLARRRK